MNRQILALVIALIPGMTEAQRFADRSQTVNPLAEPSSGTAQGTQWMQSTGGWGEFGAYRGIRDRNHAWVQRLGAFVELARFDNAASLAFTSSIEFIADPHNDIRFNPRAIVWDEGFLFTGRTGSSYWQAGYYHRCKHDIDNLLTGEERSLIFGSLLGKLLLPFSTDNGRTQGLAVVRMDIFTIRQDDRTPAPPAEHPLSLRRAIGSFGFVTHLRHSLRDPLFGIYLSAWGSTGLYSGNTGIFNRFTSVTGATLNGGLSAGAAIQGNVHFRIGLTLEYLSDTGIDAGRPHARLLSFGVTILDPATMW